jgi:hypothetical protein
MEKVQYKKIFISGEKGEKNLAKREAEKCLFYLAKAGVPEA